MGTYPPRECGIATFTKDLATAMQKKYSPSIKPKILALNDDITHIYNYPREVIYQINETDIQEYIDVAKEINRSDSIKVINLQHEFGLFGGRYGSYLLAFLETVNKPVVTTFHTVLPNPDDKRKRIVQVIADKSECLVVMTNTAVDILRTDYGLTGTEIVVIPHGIPNAQLKPCIAEKARIGFKDRVILLSFGMMSSGKGYEQVIEALPKVVEKFPNLLYIIVGETHPIVRRREGEKYRKSLKRKVFKLGLEKHVKFYNKYVTLSEIIKYLQASDIYISSSSDPYQITSGTLSYALGCGRAVVSTPFLHAKEAVTPERGLLVEFNNPDSFADAILRLLSDPKRRESMGKNAYAYTRNMTWPNVCSSYMEVLREYVPATGKYGGLPKVSLDHLIALTDDFGVIQFAKKARPDKESGYSVDDNARALIVCCMYHSRFNDKHVFDLIEIYLNHIMYVQGGDGWFLNLVNHDREVDRKHFSEDAHGRVMWALGYLASVDTLPLKLRRVSEELFVKGLKPALKMKSPRANAFNIMGLFFYNKAKPSRRNVERIRALSDHLVSLYKDNYSRDWHWFEDYLTYANSKLPEALLYAHLATGDERYLRVAESGLGFLTSITFREDMFSPIGHDGWYIQNGHRAHFDQQPIEAGSMVQTLVLAHRITKKRKYKTNAYLAFNWFLGNNHLNQVIYDKKTGGCHDGLGRNAINLNQGAESTILYLLARLSLS